MHVNQEDSPGNKAMNRVLPGELFRNMPHQDSPSKKRDSTNKVIHTPSTPATQQVKLKAGTTLHNEGTNVSNQEER